MEKSPELLEQQGLDLYQAGQLEQALAIFEQAKDIWAKGSNYPAVVEMWSDIGVVHYRRRDWGQAEYAFQQAEALAREHGDEQGLAKALGNMGSLWAKRHDIATAETYYNQAITLFREIGDEENAEATIKALSDLSLKQGQWVVSMLQYERKLIAIEHPNLWQRIQSWTIRLVKKLLHL